jgi:serine phosphatase RsbU (regulator of sigma subunit)
MARESGQREARGELGRTVQRMLLPKDRGGQFAGFAFEVDYAPASVMDGDWFFIWDDGAERRLVLGRMGGSGSQAALGVSAVMFLLHEARSMRLSLSAMAEFLNTRVLDLFDRQVTTTLLAISLGDDGTVELLNCGGPGFFVVSPEALGSTPLGVATTPDIGSCPVPLEDGDVLFAGSDGLLDSAAVSRILEYYEEHLDHVVDQEAVRELVLGLGAPAAAGDRTLLTIRKGEAGGTVPGKLREGA